MLLLLPIIGKTAYLGEVEGRTMLSTSGSPHLRAIAMPGVRHGHQCFSAL